jgi:hypothetical protein
MARLISRTQVEEIQDFIRDTSFAQGVSISGSLLVSQSFDLGSDPSEKSTITGSIELTGSLTIDGPLNVVGDQALDLTSSVSLESLDSLKFGGIKPEDFGAMDATLYVSSTSGDDNNDGRTPQFPLRTIKKAAEIAESGDDGRFGLDTGSLFTGFRIEVAAGTYLEENPIELPKNTTVWGAGLRVSKILAKNENKDLFWVNSGCYIAEVTMGGLRVFPSVDNSKSGFAVAFAPNAFITTSPYVQNCSMISNQENSFLEPYEDIPAGGGGLNVDGNVIHPDSPLASMVLDAYTQVAPNGVGCQVVGRGFIQLVSFFTNFSAYSVKVLNGGQAVLLNSNTSFGDFGMYASGSRFITGSGGNIEAFNRVRDNYTIIIDTIEDGLSAIPEFVPNTNDGIKVTDETQYFISGKSSDEVAEQAKSEYRLVSNIVSTGINNIPSLLAKSATRGYNTGSVWNISTGTQTTGSTSATSTELAIIEDRFDKVKETLEIGARATASYTLVDNIDGLVKVGALNPYTGSDATSQSEVDIINRNFNTVLKIVEFGLNDEDNPLPAITSSNVGNIKVTETPQFITDISSSAEVRNKISSSFATVYRILELGTDYAPTIVQSSSFENPSIDYQNGYNALLGNLSFIQEETIAYLSSSWSTFDYNEVTCKRDLGYIVSGAAHDLLYGGNEESVKNGNFYYLYPSEATSSQKQQTLDAIRYAGGIAERVVGDVTFVEPSINVENGYDLLTNNAQFIKDEVIAYVSSSWRGFDYDEVKCKRDVGHIIDAVSTDLRYGGNERSRIAGKFYYDYPSTATTTQLLPTLDGIEWARDLSKKLVVKDTFVTASAIIQSTYDLIVENRSLIQEETVNFIDTQFPNLVYLRDKCKRDTGYIVDAVATDLYYGGNQKSVRAGLYYGEVPSKVNGDQLNETIDGISYAKSFIDKVVVNELVEVPSVVDSTYSRVRAGSILPFTSSLVSGSESERIKVSSSFGLVEDIIKQGEDSLLAAIAGNTPNFSWTLEEPKLVTGKTIVTASLTASSSDVQLVSESFEVVTTIIESGSSIQIDKTIGSASNGLPIIQVGIPKNSYGDNLITTTIGTNLPNTITEVSNVDGGIKFNNNSQYSSSISASSTTSTAISESFRTVIDIIEYGISGSKEISGSANSSSYFEVVTLPDDSTAFYINQNQLQYFDGRESWAEYNGAEDTGSFLGSKKDPTLTLVRNEMYNFSINDLGFEDNTINEPFLIKTKRTAGTVYDVYEQSVGLTNNGITFGTLTFTPLEDTPDTLYYVNPNNVSASGVINIVDSLPLSSEQKFVYVPTKGEFEKVSNTFNNIKITTGSQYSSSLDASISDRNIVSGGFSTVIGILKSGVDSYTPTTATYDPSDGEFVMTISNHGLDVGDSVYLRPESFVFTCDMDGNRTEHKLPSIGQPAYNKQLEILSKTDDTITLNVGKSGPDISFNPTSASYDPATGEFVVTVGTHSLSVGEGIVLSAESFAFTCDMDNDQSVKSYPRVGIDPFAVRSIPITSVTDTTLTFNVGASGPNKYFTPSSASYNALTGDMVVTVGQHGLGVGRSVVLENESFAFTCDQDSDATIHSYPRSGSDPYAEQSIPITSVGFSEHTVTDAPYTASTGDVSITIASHGFSNGDYIKLNDNSLTYTCVLDGNTVEKSYPRPSYDYPSGRWLEISNVTTNTFDINIGSSSYTADHTFVTASLNGLKRQTGTFTINVGDAGSASGSLHTFVSASTNAIKHEPQSVHTFVSASAGAIKHLPQSAHTFVRTNTNSVSTLPILTKTIDGLVKRSDVNQVTSSLSGSSDTLSKISSSFAIVLDIIENGTGSLPTQIDNTEGAIAVTTETQFTTSSISASAADISFISESFEIVTRIIEFGSGSYETSSLYGSEVTASSTVAAYNLLKSNIDFIKEETIAYLSSSWSTASYDEDKCKRDVAGIVSGAAEDLIHNVYSASIFNGKFYLEYPSQAQGSQLNQTLDGIRYASRVAQKVASNVTFSSPSQDRLDTQTIINNNKEFIKEEGIAFLSASWSDFDYPEETCKRDIVHILDATITDIVYGGNERAINAGVFYYKYPSEATGSQLFPTLDGIEYAGEVAQKVVSGAVFTPPTSEKVNAYNLVLENRDLIQNEVIEYVSSSWNAADYDDVKCKRDTGYIIDAAITDLLYGGNERSIIAGDFYYKYPSQAQGSQLNQTVDGIVHAQRLSDKVMSNTILVNPSTEAEGIYQTIERNRELVQAEVISYISSSWVGFDYDEAKCSRDVGHILDAVATDLRYGGNERSVIAGEYYWLYPSDATDGQKTQTIDGIVHAANLVQKLIQNVVLTQPTATKLDIWNAIRNNRSLIQNEVTEYIDYKYPFFTYNRAKCRRDVGHILDGVATDILWGGNQRSVKSGEFYYLYPSEATTVQKEETIDGILYAKNLVRDIITKQTLLSPSKVSNTDGNIKVTSYNSVTSSIALSGSYQTEISESYDSVTGIIRTGIESFTPTTATYDPANGDFVMTIPKHGLDAGDSIYLEPLSFTFTCEMDGNRTEHKLPSVGQPAYDNRLTIGSKTDNTITVNVGKSGPNVEYNPTTASYDPATGDFVVTVESHSLSVGEGVVMTAESFAFTCDMDNNQSVKSYPRVGIDPYSVRSIPLTAVTDTTMTFNVGASGPNKYFTPVSASYNALSGDMTLTVTESFGLGVGRSVVLENESFAFTCDQDGDATIHSYPRSGSDPYAEKSIVITSVGTTSHTVTDAPYDSATGDVTITIASHGFSNGDYIKLDDNSLTYTCVLDGNVTQKSYPRPNYDYPSGRWLEISNVSTNTFDINIGSSPYVGSHTFITASADGLERQDGTFTINVGDGGSASGSLHTFVSASNRAVKHEPQSVHTFVSASNGALKHLPQSAHTFIRTDRDSVSTLPVLTENIEGLIKINDTTQFTSSLSGSGVESAYVTRSVGFINDIIRLGTDDIPFALAKWFDDTLDTPQQLTTGSYTQIAGPTLDSEYNNGSIISLTGDGSDFFKKEVTVNGVRIVVAGDVGGQTAVPDAFTEKVARMFELFTDPSGSGINETLQRNLIKTLSGDSGTYHAGLPTIQRVARGAGSDYTPNFLDDAGILYWNLTNLFDTHVQNDMVWYLNSTGDISGSGDIDAQEVIEHIFHTLHMHGLPADDIKLYSYLASDWQTGDLYLAMEEAYDAGLWDSSGYGGNSWKTDSDAFEVAAKEYLYLLNFAMFEYTDLWENGSLSPEWDDSMRTQAGILANNPLGYAFHNTYISPTISKPSLATIRSIFQDGDLGDPTIAGESGYVVTPTGTYTTDTEFGIVSSSFGQIINIIENGTGSLPTLVTNAENNIKVTNTPQFVSSISGSSTEINKVSSSIGIVEDIVQNGVSAKPTVVKNNSDVDNLIKVTDAVQFTSESFGDRLQQRLISSSIAIVTTIVENGTGSLPTVVEYGSPSESPKTLAAYNILKANIEFIQSESIAYLSSSWSTASYNEQSCSRDIGAIISGAAEDMLYNANSSSIFNGKFYYDFPSKAQGSQLQQTLDGINYAGRLAENIVRGYTFQTASAVVSGSYELIRNNREFIENETIEFLSSSWDGFTYNEITCKRDITHIIDAVSTDLLYGGNERSVNAGDYYYRFPSAAITGGVPNEDRQKDPTVTAIDYVQNIVTEIVSGAVFQTASAEVEYVYEAIRENREFLQAETVAFVNAKYPNFEYNQLSCSRDTGFIIDAVATDLRYGGNQRALTAGEFYYRFPSEATGNQLDETTDALIYTKDLIEKLVNKETLFVQTGSLNTDNGIKVTSFSPATGSSITDVTILNTISSSFAIVSDAIANGTGSTPTASVYGAVSTDSDVLTAYGLITESVPFIQNEVIAYISSSWVGFDYNEASCSRDTGLIVNGVAEDLRYGVVSASVVNAKFYYEYPSEATSSQAQQTIDGINYAYQLTEQIVKGVTFDFPSTQISASVELIRNNREFIQSESISYLSSSWEGFDYVEATCRRDVGHILDAVATDLLYGGNQRSKIAGEYYYKYPSSATTTQLEPTTTGIKYAGDVASKLVQNNIFVTASAERLAGNKVLLDNKEFIQNEVIAYISSSWSTFDYNEDKCKRDTGYILNGVATDFLYGGNERSRVNGEYYYLYPSDATVNYQTNPNGQLNQTIDGINYSARLAEKVLENATFVTASAEVSASAELLRRNRSFVQNETIEFISSSWSNVTYNEDKCRRDTGYIIDAAVTDLVYGGNERSRVAGLYYWRYPSRATQGGTPSEANQLDPTVDGIRFANGTSQNVVQNLEYTTPTVATLNGIDLLRGNTDFIKKETIAYLSSSWSEFEYNEVSCSRDLGYIIDAVATDIKYGGNARAVQAGTFYYYIPSIATTEQKPQTTDGIDFSKGLAEKVIKQKQLVFPFLLNKNGANALRAAKKTLQGKAISYTNAAFPNFDYNEEKCYRDTGFILDAIATDIIYGGNERSIRAAESYYTGVYGSAAVVINEQKKETAETNRYLRTQFQFVARQAPVEEFGSLIITTGHDFSYAGSGVTYKALPPNQGGDGVPDPNKEITEIGGGRVFFTSGNELGDFRIGGGLVIKQASGTLEGRTFSKSLFSLVTPFSLALQD